MSTTKEKKISYTLEDTQNANVKRLFRDDGADKVQVAKIDVKSGILEMEKDYANFRVAVVNWMNDNGVKYREAAKIGSELNVKGDKAKGIPPRPKKNPRLGTKTPAIVEWYALHHPEVFIEKYQVKELQVRVRIDTIVERVRNEAGQWVEVPRQVPVYESVDGLNYDLLKLKSGEQKLLAGCGTHITTKMKDANDDPDSDWDLDN